ncbi:MAG: ShlB/FhaC/HecB family hemolysin secretion/activation protein [Succinivibrio sp.]|nr:ShlB/FhaC/HecB family hemolysin secretion/activation protein [Succinivibrio sp.]
MLKHKLTTLSLSFALLSLASVPSVHALTLSNVIIKSGARIDKSSMDKKLNPYLGKEIDIALLQNILNEISDYYRKKGYLAAQAFYPEQQSQNGVVEVIVKTAKLDDIKIANYASLTPKTAYMLSENVRKFQGKEINSHELNASLLKIKDLNIFDIAGYFENSQNKPDHATLTLDLKGRSRFGYELTYDNYGNESTGKKRYTLSLNSLNLSKHADKGYLLVGTTDKKQNNLILGYSIPFTSHPTIFGFQFNYGSYELGDTYDSLDVKGNSLGGNLYIKEPLYRSLDSKVSFTGGGYYKNLTDKIESYDLELKRNKFGGYFEFETAFLKEDLNCLNSLKLDYGLIQDKSNLSDNKSQRSYLLSNFDSKLDWNFYKNFSFINTINLQYAQKGVDASDKFIPGGAYGVSAYEGSLASSDLGLFHDLKLQTKLTNRPYLDLFINFMQAYAKNVDVKKNESFYALGTGSNLSYGGFYLTASVSKAIGKNKEYAKDSAKFLLKAGYAKI